MGQIELFNHLLYLKPFNCVQAINWNHLTVCKQIANIKKNNQIWIQYLKPFNCVQTKELWFVLKCYIETIR